MAMSAKTKAKLERLKHASRRAGHHIAKGFKGTAIATGTGVAGYYGADWVDGQEADSFVKKDYVFPGALIIGGHFVKKKQYDAGTAMCAIGGFLAAHQYKVNKAKEELPKEEVPKEIKGLVERAGDAGYGMLDRAGDAGVRVLDNPLSATPSLSPTIDARDMSIREAMALVDDY